METKAEVIALLHDVVVLLGECLHMHVYTPDQEIPEDDAYRVIQRRAIELSARLEAEP